MGSFSAGGTRRLAYMPALDGLRALAILAVIVFHLKTKPFLPGGGIGVDLFFVLSGFLITCLLLQEWEQTGRIKLREFYQRRALRLLPAVGLFLLAYVVVNYFFRHDPQVPTSSLDRIIGQFFYIGSYTFNWFVAFDHHVSPGLSHLWSLSVEEQFYLVWPVVLISTLRFGMPPAARLQALALLLACCMLMPLVTDTTYKREYYGTDFRMQPLLVGCIIGQAYVAGYLHAGIARTLTFKCALTVAVVFLSYFAATRFEHYLPTQVAVSSGVLVVAAVFGEGTLLGTALSNKALTYIGRRSYALYLWHAGLGSWLGSFLMIPQLVFTLVLSLAAAELSYRLVEKPALKLRDRLRSKEAVSPEARTRAPTPSQEVNLGPTIG